MCNFCNTGFNYGCNGFWGGTQMLCRGCDGTIYVNQRNITPCGNGGGCLRPAHNCGGCHHTCHCGCGGNTTTGNANGNGGGNGGRFVCFTVCGNATGVGTPTANTTGVDLYYARQYGLYPCGYNRGCGCTLDVLTNT